jgi:hypothetical protein
MSATYTPLGESGRVVFHPFEAPTINRDTMGSFGLQDRLVITAEVQATQELIFRKADGRTEYRLPKRLIDQYAPPAKV